jgi:hypothetical protein
MHSQLLTPTSYNCYPSQCEYKLSNDEFTIALKIANEIHWLIKNYSYFKNGFDFKGIYLSELLEKGLIKNSKSIRLTLLKENIKKDYGENLLKIWQIDKFDKPQSWIHSILYYKIGHPLHIFYTLFIYIYPQD